MKTAKQYFKDNNGYGHIDQLIAEGDTYSIFDCMQEYANYLATEVAKKALKDASLAVKYRESMCGQHAETILKTKISLP